MSIRKRTSRTPTEAISSSAASAFGYRKTLADSLLTALGDLELVLRGFVRRCIGEQAHLTRLSSVDGPAEGADSSQSPILLLPAVGWTYRRQRPQHLASALGKLGHPILYVDAFSRHRVRPLRRFVRVSSNVGVLEVRIPGRPDPYREILDEEAVLHLESVIRSGIGVPPKAVVVQLPFWARLGSRLSEIFGVPLIYDRIDLQKGFSGVPDSVIAEERKLCEEVDLVAVTALTLTEGLDPSRMLLLPNAVWIGDFGLAALRDSEQIRVGYVGALGEWFDSETLALCARELPGWKFELVGRVDTPDVARLGRIENVKLHGEIPYSRVPSFLESLHIGLISFRDLPLTRAVDPVKLYEALAVGLPVVARALPPLERWQEPLVYQYENAGGAVLQLKRARSEDIPEFRRLRRRAVDDHSWERRARLLIESIKQIRSFRLN